MKLGFLVPGGVDRSLTHRVIPALLALIRRVAERHEVVVFALQRASRPEAYPLLGARVQLIALRPVRWWALAAVLAEHRRSPFALLHAFWAIPSGQVAAWAGKLCRVPVLLHLGGGELVAMPNIGYGGLSTHRGRRAVRRALTGAAMVSAASRPLVEAAERFGVRAERIPLGVDLRAWPPRPPSTHPRGQGASVRLIHVASLNRVKDQETLLQAVSLLVAGGCDCVLDLVGEDTLGGSCQRLAHSLGLTDRARFHGFLPHLLLRPLVEQADLLLLSSRHEAGPVAVLEAAVAGVPTVGTAVGHLAEWSGEAAMAVPVQDPKALAQAAAALLADEPRRLGLAAEAQRRALACDADWTAQRFDQLYQWLGR